MLIAGKPDEAVSKIPFSFLFNVTAQKFLQNKAGALTQRLKASGVLTGSVPSTYMEQRWTTISTPLPGDTDTASWPPGAVPM